MNGLVGFLAVILGDEGGEGGGEGGPRINVNVPWQVAAAIIAAVVVLLDLAAIVLLILGRRPGRLPIWRQKRGEIEETMLDEGPRGALIRLRLQLDDAIAIAKSAAAIELADIGDLRLLVKQLESAAGRIAANRRAPRRRQRQHPATRRPTPFSPAFANSKPRPGRSPTPQS